MILVGELAKRSRLRDSLDEPNGHWIVPVLMSSPVGRSLNPAYQRNLVIHDFRLPELTAK